MLLLEPGRIILESDDDHLVEEEVCMLVKFSAPAQETLVETGES